MHENFVVIVQQKLLNEQEDWTTKDHCMLPKLFVNYIAQLPDKPQSTSGDFITSGGIVPPSTISDPLHTYDISNLPLETKKIIYKYDCDCVPFYENQLGVLQECDNLADLWGLPKSPESPMNSSPLCTPTADPSPTLSPDSTQPSPSLFSNLKNNNLWINFDDSSQTVKIIYCATYLATILKLIYRAAETKSRKILQPKISQKRLRTQKPPLLSMLRKREKFQQCENSLTNLNNFQLK